MKEVHPNKPEQNTSGRQTAKSHEKKPEISPRITLIIGLAVFIGSLILNYNMEGNKFILFAAIGFIMASYGFIKFILNKRDIEIKNKLDQLNSNTANQQDSHTNSTDQKNRDQQTHQQKPHQNVSHDQTHQAQTSHKLHDQTTHRQNVQNHQQHVQNAQDHQQHGANGQNHQQSNGHATHHQEARAAQTTNQSHVQKNQQSHKTNYAPVHDNYNTKRARPYCPGCGNHTRPYDNFCSYCGSKLK
ncbi:hypothetical protein K9M79_07530 [Candidatus Woesearchaeota archaeon]|nr:hypothetical protein [Candidatus Woesearchaeota archaeon]